MNGGDTIRAMVQRLFRAGMIAASLLAGSMHAQEVSGQPLFRGGTTLVRVDLDVTSRQRPVDGLRAEDFRVLDEGKPSPILYFAHSEQPLDVILLLDTSNSMRPVMLQLAQTAEHALSVLRPGDRVALMAFDAGAELTVGFTEDVDKVRKEMMGKILQRQYAQVTEIHRSLDAAARYFLQQRTENRSRAIVIVTDDRGTSSFPQALRTLWEADAVVFGLVTDALMAEGNYYEEPRSGISKMVDETGGDFVRARDIREDFRRLLERIRSRYVLQYAVPEAKPGQERKVKVELTESAEKQHSGVRIRARRGYVVPPVAAR
jgi:VWFA-related protein